MKRERGGMVDGMMRDADDDAFGAKRPRLDEEGGGEVERGEGEREGEVWKKVEKRKRKKEKSRSKSGKAKVNVSRAFGLRRCC